MINENEMIKYIDRFDEAEIFNKKTKSIYKKLELYQDIFSKNEAKRFNECGTYLKYAVFKNQSGFDKYLIQANFCKNRWCPLCNWRRRLKYFNINKDRLLNINKQYPNTKFIFLTLTIKNTYYKNLKQDLNLILKSFKKLFDSRRIKQNPAILGYLRSLEFTIQKNDLEYVNLHIHTLVAVTAGYFDTKKDYYINQNEWTSLWQKALGVNYTPVVDVRIVKNRRTKKKSKIKRTFDEEGAVFEISKYLVKDTDIDKLKSRPEIFKEIYLAFKNVRNLGYGGVFAPKNFEKEKNEEDLIKVSDEQVQGEKVAEIIYMMEDGMYQLKKIITE